MSSMKVLGKALGTAYDVVIAGAGIMGLHTAYQLIRRDPKLSIAVLEKSSGIGSGSTGYSSALLRCFYTKDEMMTMSMGGLNVHKNWGEYLQLEDPAAKMHKIPILWLVNGPSQEAEASASRLIHAGMNASLLSAHDVQRRFPLFVDDVMEMNPSGQYFCEEDTGYFDPASALIDLRERLSREGDHVTFVPNAKVSHITMEEGTDGAGLRNVRGVHVDGFGEVTAGRVVNSAGPWAEMLNKSSGIEHKWNINPVRIQALYKNSPEIVTTREYEEGQLPTVLDTFNNVYFRPQFGSGQLLIGTADPEEEKELVVDPDATDVGSIDDDRRLRYLTAAHNRIPALKPVGRLSAFSSWYTVNFDDAHPIVGPLDGYNNLLLAMGFSGHGFKIAPMVGSMLAQSITSATLPTFDNKQSNFLSPMRDVIGGVAISVLA
eukprot:m.8000 g.8000  ORF g.8000 m.8000 type:complete len:432 (-) comp5981_c0_seq1:326-1621(-)